MKQDIQSKFCNNSKYIIDKTFDVKQEKLIDKAEKLVFTKLTSSDSHFFGTFSKVSNTKDVLTDIVYNESNEK